MNEQAWQQFANLILASALITISTAPAAISVAYSRQIDNEFSGILLSPSAIIYASFFIISGAFGVVIQKIKGKIGFRQILIFSSFIFIAGHVILYIVENEYVFILFYCVVVCALGCSAFSSSLIPLVAAWFPAWPALSTAVASLGLLLSFGIWSSAFSILGVQGDWRSSLLVASMFGVGLLIGALVIKLDYRSATLISKKGKYTYSKHHANFAITPLFSYLAMFFVLFSSTVVIIFLSSHDKTGTVTWVFFSAGALFGRLLFSVLFDVKFYFISILATLTILSVSFTSIFLDAHFFYDYRVLALAVGASYGGFLPVMIEFSRQFVVAAPAQFSSISWFSGTAGVGLGALFNQLTSLVPWIKLDLAVASVLTSVALGLFAYKIIKHRLAGESVCDTDA